LLNIAALNRHFEQASPPEILSWAWQTFAPAIAATSSFQSQSIPLLHLISLHTPDLPILFIDTGYHFPETLAFVDQLASRSQLTIRRLRPTSDGHPQSRTLLYQTNPDLCCHINKVEPLKQAMSGLRAWISGIRRDQTDHRRSTPIISRREDGVYKVCPMATWTGRQTWQYIYDHDLPSHPLFHQGYLSIGCQPCTRPVTADEDDRAGRWAGRTKTECGLHLECTTPSPAPPLENLP